MGVTSAPRRLLLTVYPPDGGAARHVIDLALGLDPERYAIDLACLEGSQVWQEAESAAHVARHPLGGAHGRPGLSDAGDLPLLLRLVARADLIHGHSSKAGFLTRLAATLRPGRRQRTIFTPHGWSFWAAHAERALYLGLERLAAHWCRALVAVSEAERAAGLAARVGRAGQYRVIPNGIDLEPFAGEPQPREGRMVFIGRLRSPKRVDLALEALRQVREAVPAATLDVVGDGPLRAGLEQLAGRLGVSDRVRFLGTRTDLPLLLRDAQCFVLASDSEGCPLSVLEAMAAGVPVVATSVGGVPELVVDGETGTLARPGDATELAVALRGVLSAPERARTLGENGRERARRLFSRERMIQDTCALYDEIAAGR
ncbi:MAG TPA: glycosyltransferase family 4 protein [Gaiellaceae bacterium]